MQIQTDYRGFKITFDETDETWQCRDLEIKPAPSLAAIKRRVDTLSKQGRRVEVQALMLHSDYMARETAEIKTVDVTMLCEPEEERYGPSRGIAVRHCWAMVDGERKKLQLALLYPLDARPELEAYLRLDAEWRRMREEKDNALVAIKAHDADSIALAAKEKAAAA